MLRVGRTGLSENTWRDSAVWVRVLFVDCHVVDVGDDFTTWDNRVNPSVYDVFKTLVGQQDLWVSLDRRSVMRSTKQVAFKDWEEPVDKPEWRTESGWV